MNVTDSLERSVSGFGHNVHLNKKEAMSYDLLHGDFIKNTYKMIKVQK